MNFMYKSNMKSAAWFLQKADTTKDPRKKSSNYRLAAQYFREAGELELAQQAERKAADVKA
jgi:hypothetical protein